MVTLWIGLPQKTEQDEFKQNQEEYFSEVLLLERMMEPMKMNE